ncbi:MAG: hypothetical protein IRY85_01140 [Micromonosporaceae bacterium]|nr:hypothetical protein [Micromonosporaceae bacterium]
MANLTLSIDDDLLRRARVRAAERGTTVNAIVRDFLETFAGVDQVSPALLRIVGLAHDSTASSGDGGRTWRRDDIYE